MKGLSHQVLIIMLQHPSVSRIQIVEPCHAWSKQYPFRGPGGMHNEMSYASSGHSIFPVCHIMRELVDQGISLVRNTLAVSVHIDTRKGSGLDGILAQVPHLIQYRIGAFKM